MNGLRMFKMDSNAATADEIQEFQVFYSRRSDGPYYRWWYEQELKQWRSARVPADELPSMTLCSSSWKKIPPALQGSVKEHYLE
jgi:hypothetical protein